MLFFNRISEIFQNGGGREDKLSKTGENFPSISPLQQSSLTSLGTERLTSRQTSARDNITVRPRVLTKCMDLRGLNNI